MARSHRPTVAEEIGQRIPFESRGQEAMVAVLRTADALRNYLTDKLAGGDVTLQQYNVLRILRGAGSQGLPTLAIGERMIERQPGVTRLVDRLVRKGLVIRRRGTTDRRRVLCHITSAGLDLLTRLNVYIDEADAVVKGALPPAGLADLLGLLDEVRAGLHEDAGD